MSADYEMILPTIQQLNNQTIHQSDNKKLKNKTASKI